MKKYLLHFLVFLLTQTPCLFLFAQDAAIDQQFKVSSIEKLDQLMNEHYVFPDVAKKTSEHLNEQLKAGHFDSFNDLQAFADALTTSVQSVNNDKHMRIRPERPRQAAPNTPERMIEDQLNELAYMRENTAGFREAKKLDGNVGYLDLRGFAPPGLGAPVADSYMNLLSTADAIIIDLRKNGGGSPGMVQYLCSYFFDEHLHLNSLYWREGDRTDEFWTLDEVGGKKLPDVPLFVLTSKYTFSGAEEFAYNMQSRKRATLVGETTGGGANPGGGFPINEKLMVFIPTGRAINPVTKSNWEGVGVVPEIKVSAEEAFGKGHELAKTAAEEFRRKNNKIHKAYFTGLQNNLEQHTATTSYETIYNSLKKCKKAGLLSEGAINQMGYEYLYDKNKPHTAEAIFKSNVELFPNSANVYDSYGEVLAHNGNTQAALDYCRKAVETARATNDPGLHLFKENLKKMEEKQKNKP